MRIVAIGRNMSRMTCTSASARTISARPATSSGRDVNAVLIADQEGRWLRERERRQRRHRRVRVQREARVEHGFGAAHLADERARKRFESRHLDLGAQHVGLRRGSAGVAGVGGADDVARERELFGDERLRSVGAPAASGRRWPPGCRRRGWSGSPRRAVDRHRPGRMRVGDRECRTTGICCSIVTLTSAPPSMNGR